MLELQRTAHRAIELRAGENAVADHRKAGAKRLDSFVDSAFAFAATFLVVGKAASMRGFDELIVELYRVPAFGLSLSIILSFWWAHRSFSLLAIRQDPICDAISIAIMIVILVYVFPLSFMIEAAVHWLSDGRLPGRGLNAQQIRPAYYIFGTGFAMLSGLYAGLYGRLLHARSQLALRKPLWPIVKRRLVNWLIGFLAGVASIALARVSTIDLVIWVPSVPYLLFAGYVLATKIPDFRQNAGANRSVG